MSGSIKCGTAEQCGDCLVGDLPTGKRRDAAVEALAIVATDSYNSGSTSTMSSQAKEILAYRVGGYTQEPDQFEAAIDISVVHIATRDPGCIAR